MVGETINTLGLKTDMHILYYFEPVFGDFSTVFKRLFFWQIVLVRINL